MDCRAYSSLGAMFFEQAARHPRKPLLWEKRDGKWQSMTWRQVAAQVSQLSRGLRAWGVEPGDRVAIVSENRFEWPIAELAIMAARAIAVPAYTSSTSDDHLHILTNSGARAAIVSTARLQQTFLPAAHRASACEFAIAMEPARIGQGLAGVEVRSWDEALAAGAGRRDDVADMVRQAKRGDTAVIIHTSGTGGAPKGVMLSHGAVLHNCQGAQDLFEGHYGYGKEVFLSFLPLSHSYEHMAGQFFPMSVAAEIYYAQGVEHLVANMAEVRPTIMTAVPRLYETMYQRIRKQAGQTTGLRRALFDRAVALGTKRYEDPASLTVGERLVDFLCDRLVRRKIARRFGGRLKFFVSGGAPLNADVGLFFTALGVKLLQGYGLTESAPVISCNPPQRVRVHTVGVPLSDTEVRIADDGEILVRGELVMQGYWNDSKATKAVLADGWLHTGDIGLRDSEGYLQITDRKKDIIVNSGGDNISPQRVEGFLALQPEIQQAMVYGDKRPHLVALLVPDPEFLKQWARRSGHSPDLASAADVPSLRDALAEAVERVNAKVSGVERVRRFIVAAEPFTVDNNMMTPTMKIRRHVIRKAYGDRLEALYR